LILNSKTFAAVNNGGFESATFSGWTVTIPIANDTMGGTFAAGAASVVTTGAHSPIEGTYMADLQAAGQGQIIPGAPYNPFPHDYDTVLSQTLVLNPGDTISGWSFISSSDTFAQDTGWVRIFDNSSVLVATPYTQVSGGSPPTVTPWVQWQYQSLTGGTFSLQLGATTMGDGLSPTDVYFDDIKITPVPEPELFALVLPCVLGLLSKFRSRRS
jgi:hypothetical protein